jgi:hypothetical protein
MARRHKFFEVLFTAEVLVELIDIPPPIPMVTTIVVINNRRDPDRIEAHTLDIVEVVDDAAVGAAAVVAEVAAAVAPGGAGEAIGEELVDGAGFPLVGGFCVGGGEQ